VGRRRNSEFPKHGEKKKGGDTGPGENNSVVTTKRWNSGSGSAWGGDGGVERGDASVTGDMVPKKKVGKSAGVPSRKPRCRGKWGAGGWEWWKRRVGPEKPYGGD